VTDDESSPQGSDLFQLYDEVDELSPSRLGSHTPAVNNRWAQCLSWALCAKTLQIDFM